MPKGTPTGGNTSNNSKSNSNTNTNSNTNYLTPNIDTTTYIRREDRAVYNDGKVISAERIERVTNPPVDHWMSTNK